MNIEDFYQEDERRRRSTEVELGDAWTDDSDPGTPYEISWIEATGEVYAMREEASSKAAISSPTVQILGKVAQRQELEELASGWQDAMGDPGSLRWIRERLQRSIPSDEPSSSAGDEEGEKLLPGANQRSDDPGFLELDKLSSEELHDRAVHLAEQRLDLKFFWDLLKDIPVAEAAAGNVEAAEKDALSASRLLRDSMGQDKGRLAEALRPVYIEYLLDHEERDQER
jgi:hypothetical protein